MNSPFGIVVPLPFYS